MKTNFFEQIAAMQAPGQWNIVIRTDEKGHFTVSTYFSGIANGNDPAKTVKPLVASGTADEFDEGYFEMLREPIQETAGLVTNKDAYLKTVEKLKSGQVKKDSPAGDGIEVPKENKEEKRKAYAAIIKQIVELDAACKYEEAIALLPTLTDYPEKEAELTKRRAELERKQQQKNQLLFKDQN